MLNKHGLRCANGQPGKVRSRTRLEYSQFSQIISFSKQPTGLISAAFIISIYKQQKGNYLARPNIDIIFHWFYESQRISRQGFIQNRDHYTIQHCQTYKIIQINMCSIQRYNVAHKLEKKGLHLLIRRHS